MLLVKKRTTTEGQDAANKCGYGSWKALLGQEASGLVQQPLRCTQGSALVGMQMPHFLPPTAKKKVLQEFQAIAQGRFCHLIDFGSFVLLCNFVIRNKLLALTE